MSLEGVADPNCGEATAMPRFVSTMRRGTFANNKLRNLTTAHIGASSQSRLAVRIFGKVYKIMNANWGWCCSFVL